MVGWQVAPLHRHPLLPTLQIQRQEDSSCFHHHCLLFDCVYGGSCGDDGGSYVSAAAAAESHSSLLAVVVVVGGSPGQWRHIKKRERRQMVGGPGEAVVAECVEYRRLELGKLQMWRENR